MKRPSKCPNCGVERDCVTCKHDGGDYMPPDSTCARCLDGREMGYYKCNCNNTPVTGSIHPEPKFDLDELVKATMALNAMTHDKANGLAMLTGAVIELDPAMPDTGFKIVCGSGLYDKIMKKELA